jgi:hypothetical protein
MNNYNLIKIHVFNIYKIKWQINRLRKINKQLKVELNS